MISPLPRNKRAKNPRQLADGSVPVNTQKVRVADEADEEDEAEPTNGQAQSEAQPVEGFANAPLNALDIKA
jgi:hypothetical protein